MASARDRISPDRRIRIFLSSSWDSTAPAPGLPSDQQITNAVAKLIKSIPHLELLNPQVHQARATREKIASGIDDADVVLCIFTRRLPESVPFANRDIPAAFVLSEAGFALGRYLNYEGTKRVVGFFETGVNLAHLGLLREEGTDLVPFSRESFADAIPEFKNYLADVQSRLRGTSALIPPPYRQQFVKKSVRVHRNGTGISRLRCEALILDPDALAKRGVGHKIWTQRTPLPALESMLNAHIRNRKDEPFFTAVVVSKNGRVLNQPPEIHESDRENDHVIRFTMSLPPSLDIRPGDIVEYQYAWGAPGIFARSADDLAGKELEEISLLTNHGPIRHAELWLEVEREARGTRRGQSFSKEPFFTVSTKPGDGPFSDPLPPAAVTVDENIWYQLYDTLASDRSSLVP